MGNFDVEKTIVVPDSGGTGNNFLAGMLASACQQRGLDANAVMALCGNRNGFVWKQKWLIWKWLG